MQSPWAYRFIRYVINEHCPYYAYDELADSSHDYKLRWKILSRLYFRLANYLQAEEWITCSPNAFMYVDYIRRGCEKCAVRDIQNLTDIKGELNVASVALMGDYKPFCERLLDMTKPGSVLILEEIHKDKATLAYWGEIIRDKRVGVSFDLYDCGLVFFDLKLYKKNYVVNV